VSVEQNSDGDYWLRLVATDGTSWHIGWDGNTSDAVSIATEFAETIVDGLLY
jgi:hypothetical protein